MRRSVIELDIDLLLSSWRNKKFGQVQILAPHPDRPQGVWAVRAVFSLLLIAKFQPVSLTPHSLPLHISHRPTCDLSDDPLYMMAISTMRWVLYLAPLSFHCYSVPPASLALCPITDPLWVFGKSAMPICLLVFTITLSITCNAESRMILMLYEVSKTYCSYLLVIDNHNQLCITIHHLMLFIAESRNCNQCVVYQHLLTTTSLYCALHS